MTTSDDRFAWRSLLFPAALVWVALTYVVPGRLAIGEWRLFPMLGATASYLGAMALTFVVVLAVLIALRSFASVLWPRMPHVVERITRATGFPATDAALVPLCLVCTGVLAYTREWTLVPLGAVLTVGFAGASIGSVRERWPVQRYQRKLPEKVDDGETVFEERDPDEWQERELSWTYARDGGDPIEQRVTVYVRHDDHARVRDANPTARGDGVPAGEIKRIVDLIMADGIAPQVRHIAQHLLTMAKHRDFSVYEELSNALACVHAIRYVSDEQAHGKPDYWQYPLETLYLGTGDCEDSSLLAAAIFYCLFAETDDPDARRDVQFLYVQTPEGPHAAIAVEGSENFPGTYMELDAGRRFFYCETTATGWRVGELPRDYRVLDAIPIRPPDAGGARV